MLDHGIVTTGDLLGTNLWGLAHVLGTKFLRDGGASHKTQQGSGAVVTQQDAASAPRPRMVARAALRAELRRWHVPSSPSLLLPLRARLSLRHSPPGPHSKGPVAARTVLFAHGPSRGGASGLGL